MSDELDKMFARAKELKAQGKHFSEAHSIADLERRIEAWPNPAKHFDGHLHLIVFGDFRPPKSALSVPELGLTIFPEPVESSVARAPCVLKAKIAVESKTVEAVRSGCVSTP